MNAIEIKNLKKHFPATRKTRPVKAVDGVSFEIKKGECFGFLGPNGAGKTTTIRCLMGFITPTSGTVSILGQNVKGNTKELMAEVGFLSGNVRLYRDWTGHDHIRYVESIRGKSQRVDELIKRLDFDPTKKFGNLSSGNKQKLGLILALMSDPSVLVMDEPTVGLDPLLQNEIYEIIEELKKKGTTILVSSHNLPEVERICDRVGIIRAGKIVELGDIKTLRGKSLSIVKVYFEGAYKKADYKIAGVDKVTDLGNGLELTVSGNMEAILKKVSSAKIQGIEITKASLEEIFLKFYEKE